MKCSSRRNCNSGEATYIDDVGQSLNEVQLPKELQQAPKSTPVEDVTPQ